MEGKPLPSFFKRDYQVKKHIVTTIKKGKDCVKIIYENKVIATIYLSQSNRITSSVICFDAPEDVKITRIRNQEDESFFNKEEFNR